MSFVKFIKYGFAGLMTTSINFIVDMSLRQIGLSYFLSISIAWFSSVAFAFFINKIFVFKNNDECLLPLVLNFYGARLFTLGLEYALTHIFVAVFGYNQFFVKINIQILIIILNFFIGKNIFDKQEGDIV